MGGDADKPRRKHRKTGNPRGGVRPNAGRPEDTPNLLEYGEASAIRALNLRVPDNAHPVAKALAGEALETIVKVMRGEVPHELAPHMRNASKDLREEICKPLPKPVALTDADGGKLTVNIVSLAGEADDA